MTTSPIAMLETYGPERCQTMSRAEARAYCRRLATPYAGNFAALRFLAPTDRRDDFAALYAFTRWAADLGDGIDDPDRTHDLLEWWRRELRQCLDGEPRHPVFIALAPTIERFELPAEPFEQLLDAFDHDRATSRYETWGDVVDACRGTAAPVGRLVLRILNEPVNEDQQKACDEACIALQLTNHWRNVSRDRAQRNRIYIPHELIDDESFDDRLLRSAQQGYGVDQQFLAKSRSIIRQCVERTWPYYERSHQLLELVSPSTRPIVRLCLAEGQHLLRKIELWNYETALHRPTLSITTRAWLTAATWLALRTAPLRRSRPVNEHDYL